MLAPWLKQLTTWQCWQFFLAVNVAVVGASIVLWHLVRWFHPRSLSVAPAPRVTGTDVGFAISSIILNAAISVFGWSLMKEGYLVLSEPTWTRLLIDFPLMVLTLDLLMYATHRIAHWEPVYKLLHESHHRHIETNSLSLFVLHPGEVLGFAAMLILTIIVIRPCEVGLSAYLALNLAVGTIGHSGLQSRKRFAALSRIEQLWAFLATFHGHHHEDGHCNFGFYTSCWDRMFRSHR